MHPMTFNPVAVEWLYAIAEQFPREMKAARLQLQQSGFNAEVHELSPVVQYSSCHSLSVRTPRQPPS
jgi:hypothetical protein